MEVPGRPRSLILEERADDVHFPRRLDGQRTVRHGVGADPASLRRGDAHGLDRCPARWSDSSIGATRGRSPLLVARHGPMVLAVCRGVLKDRNDAEDAFQATFLVLFRKAGGLQVGRIAGELALPRGLPDRASGPTPWPRAAANVRSRRSPWPPRPRRRVRRRSIASSCRSSTPRSTGSRTGTGPRSLFATSRASPTNRPRTSSAGRSARSAAASRGRGSCCAPGSSGAASRRRRRPCRSSWPARPRRRRPAGSRRRPAPPWGWAGRRGGAKAAGAVSAAVALSDTSCGGCS